MLFHHYPPPAGVERVTCPLFSIKTALICVADISNFNTISASSKHDTATTSLVFTSSHLPDSFLPYLSLRDGII